MLFVLWYIMWKIPTRCYLYCSILCGNFPQYVVCIVVYYVVISHNRSVCIVVCYVIISHNRSVYIVVYYVVISTICCLYCGILCGNFSQ